MNLVYSGKSLNSLLICQSLRIKINLNALRITNKALNWSENYFILSGHSKYFSDLRLAIKTVIIKILSHEWLV